MDDFGTNCQVNYWEMSESKQLLLPRGYVTIRFVIF